MRNNKVFNFIIIRRTYKFNKHLCLIYSLLKKFRKDNRLIYIIFTDTAEMMKLNQYRDCFEDAQCLSRCSVGCIEIYIGYTRSRIESQMYNISFSNYIIDLIEHSLEYRDISYTQKYSGHKTEKEISFM